MERRETGKQFSVRTVLWVWMVLLAIVPLLTMALQGLHCGRQAVVQLEHAHLRSVLSGREARLDAWLMERERDLRAASLMSCGAAGCVGLLDHIDADHVAAVLRSLNASEPDVPLYETVAVYDASGARLVAQQGSSHEDPDSLLDVSLREQLRDARGIVVSAAHAHGDGHVGLHMAWPIRAADGTLAASIVVNVELAQTLTGILEPPAGLGPSGKLYLVDAERRYVTPVSGDASRLGTRANLPAAMRGASTEPVLRYIDWRGVPVLGCAEALHGFSWLLVAEVAEADALDWLGILRRRALLTGAVALCVVFMLAAWYASSLTEPLRVLASSARRIAGGAVRDRVTGLKGREAGEVAQAFNEMMDTLQDTQQKLVQSASLAAIGELSSGIVHEMRNPLSSIKMNLNALRSAAANDPVLMELGEIAATQVERLEHMLADLLRYGKPVELNCDALSFRELAEDVRSTLGPFAEVRGVDLRMHDQTAGYRVSADREQLCRALSNLVENAVLATRRDGAVTVTAEAADGAAGPALQITVSDTGPGIPDHLRTRLFEPFVTTHQEGTGLGLANVRKIAELHGGCVRAGNGAHGGAVFTLVIPDAEGENG